MGCKNEDGEEMMENTPQRNNISEVQVLISELQFLDKITQINHYHEDKISKEVKMVDLVI